MRTVEPFEFFHRAVPTRGIPHLSLRHFEKTCAVQWYDGGVRDYHLFETAVDKAALRRELTELWEANRDRSGPRASLVIGSAAGSFWYVPHNVGEAAYAIVLGHFNAALNRMLDAGLQDRGQTWDEFLATCDKVRELGGTADPEQPDVEAPERN